MTFTPHGKHLIAGQWVSSAQQFNSSPAHGDAFSFSVGSVDLVDQAVQAAEAHPTRRRPRRGPCRQQKGRDENFSSQVPNSVAHNLARRSCAGARSCAWFAVVTCV